MSREMQAVLLARDPWPGLAGEFAASCSDVRATHAGGNGTAKPVVLWLRTILPKEEVLSSLSRLTAPDIVLRRREKGLEVRGTTDGGRGSMGVRSVWLRGVKIESGVASAALAVESLMGAALLARGVESI